MPRALRLGHKKGFIFAAGRQWMIDNFPIFSFRNKMYEIMLHKKDKSVPKNDSFLSYIKRFLPLRIQCFLLTKSLLFISAFEICFKVQNF